MGPVVVIVSVVGATVYGAVVAGAHLLGDVAQGWAGVQASATGTGGSSPGG